MLEAPQNRRFPWKKFLVRGLIVVIVLLGLTWIAVDQIGKRKLGKAIAELQEAGYETDWQAWLKSFERNVPDDTNIAKHPIFADEETGWPDELKLPTESARTLKEVRFRNGVTFDPRAYFADTDPSITLENAKSRLIALKQPNPANYEELLGILERPHFETKAEGISLSSAISYQILQASNTLVYHACLDFHTGEEVRAWRAIHAITSASEALRKDWVSNVLLGLYYQLALLESLHAMVDEAIRTDHGSSADWEKLLSSIEQIDPKRQVRSVIRGEIAFSIYATKNLDAFRKEEAKIFGATENIWVRILEKLKPLGYDHSFEADLLRHLMATDEILIEAPDLNPRKLEPKLAQLGPSPIFPEGFGFVAAAQRFSASQDALLLKIAIKRYHLQHSTWPTTLEALSPDFIDEKRIKNLKHFKLSFTSNKQGLPALRVDHDVTGNGFLSLDLSPLPQLYSP